MMGNKILLIVNDDTLIQSLIEQLQINNEFVVSPIATVADASKITKANNFDLIVFDADTQDVDAYEACQILRRNFGDTPIVVLVSTTCEINGISLPEGGADEFILKPFRLVDLLVLLRSQICSYENRQNSEYLIGPFIFRPSEKLLLNETKNNKVRLTEKEVAILSYLYRAGDGPVGRETLLGEVWEYNAGVTTHTLETHVYRLRQKMELDPSNAQILVTETGGYRLIP